MPAAGCYSAAVGWLVAKLLQLAGYRAFDTVKQHRRRAAFRTANPRLYAQLRATSANDER
jgi:hypothetical protein